MTPTTAHAYQSACAAALVIAAALCVRGRRHIALLQPSYWRWLLAPWKLITFVVSAAVLCAFAPYSGDTDWDIPISIIMSLLTFATAPWAIGELWQRRSFAATYIAVCAGLLSASWSFDAYWLWRRGLYPDNWLGNLAASSSLYLAAGVLWNLDFTRERNWTFSFVAADWPSLRPPPPWKRIALPVVALMAIVGASVILPFLLWRP